MYNIRSLYHNMLKQLYLKIDYQIFEEVSQLAAAHSEQIAEHFYQQMLENDAAMHFINHETVKNRLHKSMVHWLSTIFNYPSNDEAIEKYISAQLKVGQVHARIDLPICLVNYGMFFIKNDLEKILSSELTDQKLILGLMLMNRILDCALGIINESYQDARIINENNSQAFKLHFSTHNLAFDCERLRSSLSDWMRELLLIIAQQQFSQAHLPSIRHSNFGLWITHKAELFLSNRLEFNTLLQLLEDIEQSLQNLTSDFEQEYKRNYHIKQLNMYVSKAVWTLGEVAKEILEQDNGRDNLTRLFNRRYLGTVLRHETECSLKSDLTFGILVIDIDFFKQINDKYGHNNGDIVLTQLAEILANQVRAGDFVFRLGGEEFLIVLADVTLKMAERMAERIRLIIEQYSFVLLDHSIIEVTVSIGIALHDRHPDFNHTITRADQALYQAKHNGRNRIVIR